MVYVVGIIGLVCGFMVGQLVLLLLLKGRSNKEILSDGSLKWTYGVLNWLIAGVGCWAAVSLYGIYFGG